MGGIARLSGHAGGILRLAAEPKRWIGVTAPLAAERDDLVVAAVAAVQAHEAMSQGAAFVEGVELVLHALRQVGACSGFSARGFARFASLRSNVANPETRELRARCSASAKSRPLSNASTATRTASLSSSVMCSMRRQRTQHAVHIPRWQFVKPAHGPLLFEQDGHRDTEQVSGQPSEE
jgi:hypothetical protein